MTQLPIGIGLIGTGYAAKVRAEAINAEPRATLVGVSGNTPTKAQAFAQTHQTRLFESWQAVVNHSDVQLVVISNNNSAHGEIARAALFAGKHVVVEYPIALEVSTAESLLALAQNKQRLLHVEHIELMGGVHQALLATLPKIGTPFYTRYATITPQNPAPEKWTYNHDLFGFPLMGALSRLNRFTNAFGAVDQVSCQASYLDTPDRAPRYYAACMCTATLKFRSGLVADVIYGKGEALWQPERKLEVQGDKGAIVFNGEKGTLINAQGEHPIETSGRRGLFARDTAAVIDYLINGTPLYTNIIDSIYTMRVAEAARKAAETGQLVNL
ncbi:Gfo/Idh/MocA family oxidoreductase [filamentous cyanobacterium LEGE 11480]|uniref:Gfo/Idh/MocA family oxidoreductase n=1 Tax=Romeriopsis navalis LEGE 11480 TaxID=2777977 RepID=A0A928Z4V0_9CYAN|nr:Gfo/Idh/MocA family oxidoreductase [Romeriopsis navalis]MBE9031397.1 Gfo/Idh/MocA family oxidoreductase [Romeriopsis navalis LEGE 11480]